jgi:hypothetical protein
LQRDSRLETLVVERLRSVDTSHEDGFEGITLQELVSRTIIRSCFFFSWACAVLWAQPP